MTSSQLPRIFVSRRVPSKAMEMLQAACNVTGWKSDEPPPRAEYLESVKGIDALYCLLTDKVDVELLDAAGPNLKVVSTMSVGFDHIDVKECTARKITVGYTPGILTSSTAELTVSLLLATSRRLKEGLSAVVNGEWGSWKPTWLCGSGLDGSTVGIVGLGRIGIAVAERLKPFGVEHFLYSGRSEKSDAEKINAKFVPLDDLLKTSDFVIACCALTPDTACMFNKSAFSKMKKSAIFVNTSRGGVVQQEDLYSALSNGDIAGAGLDVTTPEPLPTDSPLLSLPNCLVLPHIGSATYDTREAMAVLAAKNLLAGIRGETMPCQLN